MIDGFELRCLLLLVSITVFVGILTIMAVFMCDIIAGCGCYCPCGHRITMTSIDQYVFIPVSLLI